jgi:hypothetical protein
VLLIADGGVAFWNNGLLRATDPEDLVSVTVGWLGFNVYVFLVYFALFGFLAQFVFRYLTLCRNRHISTGCYFTFLALVQLFPLAAMVACARKNFPPPDHRVLRDQAVADRLGLNASDVVFSVYSPLGVSSSSQTFHVHTYIENSLDHRLKLKILIHLFYSSFRKPV